MRTSHSSIHVVKLRRDDVTACDVWTLHSFSLAEIECHARCGPETKTYLSSNGIGLCCRRGWSTTTVVMASVTRTETNLCIRGGAKSCIPLSPSLYYLVLLVFPVLLYNTCITCITRVLPVLPLYYHISVYYLYSSYYVYYMYFELRRS